MNKYSSKKQKDLLENSKKNIKISSSQSIVKGYISDFIDGKPCVTYQQKESKNFIKMTAQSLVPLSLSDKGSPVLLMPLDMEVVIMGILQDFVSPKLEKQVVTDGKQIKISAEDSLELSCGDAKILLQADGQIQIKGGHITNHAAGINRIRGAAVKIN